MFKNADLETLSVIHFHTQNGKCDAMTNNRFGVFFPPEGKTRSLLN